MQVIQKIQVSNINKDIYFKHLKFYFAGSAKCWKFSKDKRESITIKRIERATGESIENLDILYLGWGSKIEGITPPSHDRWSRSNRDYLTNYDFKNNFKFDEATEFLAVEKVFNVHNKNGFNPDYLKQLYNAKKLKLQQRAESIRAERARQERIKKRELQEAQTAQFKNNFMSELKKLIAETVAQENYKEAKMLLTLRDRVENANIIDEAVQKCLTPNNLFKNVFVKCKTRSRDGSTWYITEFKVPFIEVILEGAYSLMLHYFKDCNGCEWWSNTELFEIIEASELVDKTKNHEYIK